MSDRARLAHISVYAFEAKTVVQQAPANPEDKNTWISICGGDGGEILRCRGTDAKKTELWKDALTASMVLAALLASMKPSAKKAASAASACASAIILKSVYMLKVNRDRFAIPIYVRLCA